VHPVRALLDEAARGRFPAPDGSVDVVPSPPGPVDAVVGFTAHHVVAADVDEQEVRQQLDPEDIGAAALAPFITWLGRRLDADPGQLDLVLAASASPAELELVEAVDGGGHPRVARADRYRTDVRVYQDEFRSAVVILGRGLAGRLEVSIEVDPGARGRGLGRRLAASARSLVPAGEPLYAQVSPGNAASVRAFLAAGYVPIGSEVLFLRP
jgi:GNAT superfamily N-acetyltransferase